MKIEANGLIWSAARSGKEAVSREKLSYFSEAMSFFLAAKDTEIHEIEQNVIEWVKLNSEDRQLPISSRTLTGNVYLNDSTTLKKQFKEAWASTLRRATVGEVTHFANQYRGSDYEYSARQWLRQNANRHSSYFTQYSPIMIEDGWQSAHASGSDLLVPRITGSFFFDRVIKTEAPVRLTGQLFKPEMPSWEIMRRSGQVFVAAKLLPAHANATLAERPSAYFGLGDRLSVSSVVENDDGVWLYVTSETGERSYVNLPSDVKATVKAVGRPAQEVFVGPRPGGLATLADPAPIERVAASCAKLTWASIAVPYAEDPDKQRVLDLRASNAAFVLTRELRKSWPKDTRDYRDGPSCPV